MKKYVLALVCASMSSVFAYIPQDMSDNVAVEAHAVTNMSTQTASQQQPSYNYENVDDELYSFSHYLLQSKNFFLGKLNNIDNIEDEWQDNIKILYNRAISNTNEIISFHKYPSLSKEAKEALHKFLDDMFRNAKPAMN